VSRDGWALLDDSERARLDAGPWPWAAPRDLKSYAAELSSRAGDGDARCAQWAGSGECTRNNVAFMLSDTVPDDYDQLTWIAGLGSRLAARPANWTAEMHALGPTLSRARRQLEAMVGRVRGDPDRLEMVHNATALLQETAPRRALP